MLNWIWGGMMLMGLCYGAFCGSLAEVTQALIVSSKEAISLGLTMLGIMAFWCGVLETGERAGLIAWFTKLLGPALDFLFPELPGDHPARQPITINLIANMLGLGAAATPAGLTAMKLLNEDKENATATNSMCTFLILNVSSLQLVPITMLAYRSQYGAADPSAILGPAFLATACSTGAAVLFCKTADVLTLWHRKPEPSLKRESLSETDI